MLQGAPTLFPNGVSNAAPGSFGSRVPQLWPPQNYTFFDDFDSFNAALAATGLADWLLTPTGSAVAPVVSDAFGGVLSIVTPATDNSGNVAQWQGRNATSDVAETFTFLPGKELWFATRFQLSDVIQSDFIAGLAISDSDPFTTAPSDGVYFMKTDGAATLSLVSAIVTPVTASVVVATLVNATNYEFGFHYNGIDRINAYQSAADGSWNYVGGLGVTALPTRTLAVTFGFIAGEAVIKSAFVDWIFASRER